MPRRLAWFAVLVVTPALSGAGCRRGAAPAEPRTLTLAVRADVTGFFPTLSNESYTLHVNWNVLEGLVRFDSRFALQPALAESWENPDELTHVFQLRPGLVFSDGQPVRAADVVASLQTARERAWVTSDYLQAIESVRAEGPRRIVIRTREPYPTLLFKLPWGLVLPQAALGATPVPLVGTGPYRLLDWRPGQEFVLVRNERYRGPPPAYARVRFVVVPDARERIARVLRGDAQIADQIPLEAVDELRAAPGVNVFAGPSTRVILLVMRVDRPPFSDPKLREAIERAVDRAELVRRVEPRAEPASQAVPASIHGYNPRLGIPPVDRARARELLAAAGYPRGLDVRLDGPYNRYVNDRQILEELARQLGEVGVRITVNALDKAEFFALTRSGSSLLHIMGWASETGEAGHALEGFFRSQRAGVYSGNNTSGLADAELDRLVDATSAAHTTAARLALLQRAAERVAALRPVVPLLVQADAVAVSRDVAWQPTVDFAFRLEEIRPAATPR